MQVGGTTVVQPAAERPRSRPRCSRRSTQLTSDLGADWSQWRYGRVHTQAFPHPILTAFDLPTVERRGGNGAVGADGASYREIIDVSNWDNSLTINTPGTVGPAGQPVLRQPAAALGGR